MNYSTRSHVISGCYERFVLGHEATTPDCDDGYAWTQRFAVKAHQGPVKCVKAKGGLLVSGGDDDCVRMYDLVNGKDLGTLVEHEGAVTCLDLFTPGTAERPSHLFSGGVDGLINIWRVKDFKIMSKLRGHKRGVKSVAVHSSGKIALSCDEDSSLCMWNLIKGRVTYKSKLAQPIDEIVLSQIDNRYVGRGRDTIVVRDMENPDVNESLGMKGKNIQSMCYPGSTYLFSGCADGTVCTWDLRSSSKGVEFKAHGKRVKGLAVPFDMGGNDVEGSSYPNYFVSASSEGDLKVWDTRKLGSGGDTVLEALGTRQLGVRLTCLCAAHPKEWKREQEEEEEEPEGKRAEPRKPKHQASNPAGSRTKIMKKKRKGNNKKYENMSRFD